MFYFSRLTTVCLVLTLVLICPIPATGATDDPITIAFVGDFSDVTMDYCLRAYDAARLALDEINESGGVLGRKVVMVRLDGGNDPKMHYQYISELGSGKQIAAIFGGGSSAALLEASKASRERQVPYLISVGNSQKVVVDYGHPYVFLFVANSYMETKAFSIFATLMPWRKYAWLGPDYVWGREVFAYFHQHFLALGTPIEWVTQAWHPLDNREFGPLIKQIVEAKPEALFIASWGSDMVRIVKQAQPYGFFDKMAVFSQFMAEEPQAPVVEGTWSLSRAPFSYLAEKYPQTKQFVERYHERTGLYPSGFAICAYDALQAWKKAVEKAETLDRNKVADALKGLSFEGLRGKSYIRPIDGQMNCPTFFGRTSLKSDYPVAIMESIIEIPAEKTWPTEDEVVQIRKKISRFGD